VSVQRQRSVREPMAMDEQKDDGLAHIADACDAQDLQGPFGQRRYKN